MKALNLTIITSLILINGCATTAVKKESGGMIDAYSRGVHESKAEAAAFIKDNLTVKNTYGYVEPYIPVRVPGDVRMVWIPTHKSPDDKDVLVAGHWIYVVVKDPAWFIDEQAPSKAKIPVIVPVKNYE